MKDLIKFAFDIFSHILPGSIVIILIFISSKDVVSLDSILQLTKEIELGNYLMIVLAFVIGFAITPIGRFFYKNVCFNFWKLKIKDNNSSFISDKYSIIREHSPLNFEYVERWNMYCTMSHNLAIVSIILLIVSVVKLFNWDNIDGFLWICTTIGSIILILIFHYNAVKFSIWAADDINSTISTLKLSEKKISQAKGTKNKVGKKH